MLQTQIIASQSKKVRKMTEIDKLREYIQVETKQAKIHHMKALNNKDKQMINYWHGYQIALAIMEGKMDSLKGANQ